MAQQTKTFAQKILAARMKMGFAIKRDSENTHRKSRYASLASLLEAIDGPLHDEGFVILQWVDGELLHTQLTDAETGEVRIFTYPISCPNWNDPQQVGIAVTYARRYSLRTFFCLADADDDGNTVAEAAKSAPKPEPKKQPSEDDKKAADLIKSWGMTKENLEELKGMTEGKWVAVVIRAADAGVSSFDELVLFIAGENAQS